MPTQPGAVTPTNAHSGTRRRSRGLAARARSRLRDQRGSQITDNLGLIVIGIVAVVAVGGLITGLDTSVFNYVSSQLGLG